MDNNIFIEVNTTVINTQDLFKFIADPAHGAISTFVGMVRNKNLGRNVVSVNYDVHDAMAKKVLLDIANKAISKHEQAMKIYISHFKGKLEIGGISIAIGVSSPHRKESIDVCNHLIEVIKHEAPIWKKEYYEDGESDWVKGHALCKH